MSFQAMAWAIKQECPDSLSKFLLLALANYVDEDGRCWPSQERLCKDTQMAERTLRNKLHELSEAKLIRIEPETNGFLKRNMYVLLRPAPHAGGPASDVTTTGTTCRSPPAPRADKPIITNLSKNLKGKIFIRRGSQEWEAWWKHRGKEPLVGHYPEGEGQFFTSQWPPSKEHAA